jgi:very-short-patch-repair endonuclease
MSRQSIKQFIANHDTPKGISEKFVQNRFPSVYTDILDETSFLVNPTFPQRLAALRLDVTEHLACGICGKPSKINLQAKIGGMFNAYCSVQCRAQRPNKDAGSKAMQARLKDPEVMKQREAKKKQTNLERYGVENVSHAPGIAQKISDIRKANPLTGDALASREEKRLATIQEKYGVDHITQVPSVQQNMRLGKESEEYKIRFAEIQKVILDGSLERFMVFLKENKPEFSLIESTWNGVSQPALFHCNIHDLDFSIKPNWIVNGNRACPGCQKAKFSMIEKEVSDWLEGYSIEKNTRILDGQEIDIYIPDRKLGIEINGVYWHHDGRKNKTDQYHLKKTLKAQELGITLLHFWDTEIYEKPEIVKSMILSRIGVNQRIYARKTIVKNVAADEARQFLLKNHIQGAGVLGKDRYGLYLDDELVCLMTFLTPRFNKNFSHELYRFCNKLGFTVIGGASKLLSHARKSGIDNIITYANRRFSDGNLYKMLGFEAMGSSVPNYEYVKGSKVVGRLAAQKHKLPELLGNSYNSEMSESENMFIAGFNKIFDCGNLVFGMK